MQRPTTVTVFGILNIAFAILGVFGIFASFALLSASAMSNNPVVTIIRDNPAYAAWMKISIPLGILSCALLHCNAPRNAAMTWQARPGKENARLLTEPGASAFRSVGRSAQDDAETRPADREGGDRREEGACESSHSFSPVGGCLDDIRHGGRWCVAQNCAIAKFMTSVA